MIISFLQWGKQKQCCLFIFSLKIPENTRRRQYSIYRYLLYVSQLSKGKNPNTSLAHKFSCHHKSEYYLGDIFYYYPADLGSLFKTCLSTVNWKLAGIPKRYHNVKHLLTSMKLWFKISTNRILTSFLQIRHSFRWA